MMQLDVKTEDSILILVIPMGAVKKKGAALVRLISSAGTGYTYYTTKNAKKLVVKLKFRKYDPVVRKHVEFVEKK